MTGKARAGVDAAPLPAPSPASTILPGLISDAKQAWSNFISCGGAAVCDTISPFMPPEGELGEAAVVDEAAVMEKAAAATGNQTVVVANRQAAEAAAEKFLGTGSTPITQQYGTRAGQVIGRISSDGSRVVRDDGDHFNFENKATGGNLHVVIGGR